VGAQCAKCAENRSLLGAQCIECAENIILLVAQCDECVFVGWNTRARSDTRRGGF
jgi:hypothetical protein